MQSPWKRHPESDSWLIKANFNGVLFETLPSKKYGTNKIHRKCLPITHVAGPKTPDPAMWLTLAGVSNMAAVASLSYSLHTSRASR